MEPVTATPPKRGGPFGLISAILFVLSYFGARMILEFPETAQGVKILAALLPVAPFIWMLWEIVKGVRHLDELEQRIQLEALALAYPLALVLLMILGLLQIAITLPPEDWSYRHVWAMLPLLYFGGLVIARRRYK